MSKPRANKGQRGRIRLDFYKVTPTFLSTIKVNLLQFLIFPLWPNPPQVIVGSLVTYQLRLAYKLLSFTTSLACVSCFQNVLWPLVLPILHPFIACSPFLSGAVGCTNVVFGHSHCSSSWPQTLLSDWWQKTGSSKIKPLKRGNKMIQ